MPARKHKTYRTTVRHGTPESIGRGKELAGKRAMKFSKRNRTGIYG